MKKFIILGVLILAVASFFIYGIMEDTKDPGTEISTGPLYRIMEHESGFYLKFHDESKLIENTFQGDLSKRNYIRFSNFDEMHQTIFSQNYDAEQLRILETLPMTSVNGMAIHDLHYQHIPSLPDNMSVHDMRWYGYRYGFDIQSDNTGCVSGTFDYYALVDTDYKTLYERHFPVSLKAGETLESTTNDPTRDATITFIRSDTYRKKIIQYTITEGNTKLEVNEEYLLSTDAADTYTSSSVPESVTIFGTTNIIRFIYQLKGFDRRPSLETISQFGTDSIYIKSIT